MELVKHISEHEALGFPTEEPVETDPVFLASEAASFVTGDKANLDNQSGVNTGDQDLSGKVDKITNYSLVADTEIAKIHAAGSDDQDLTPYLKHDGTVALSGNLDFSKYMATALVCDNGTSFPASPATAQWFYRSDIKTLFTYEGGWKALQSFGAVTLYVDGTNGTDAVGQGYSSGAGATKTIQYALGLVPAVLGGNTTINVAAGTYQENLIIPYVLTGPYAITVLGILTEVLSDTATGGVDAVYSGTGNYGYAENTGAAYTVNAYRHLLMMNPSGHYAPIQSNTSTRILHGTMNGVFTKFAAGQQIKVYDWAVHIAPASGRPVQMTDNSVIRFENIKITAPTGAQAALHQNEVVKSVAYCLRCQINAATNQFGVFVTLASLLGLQSCIVKAGFPARVSDMGILRLRVAGNIFYSTAASAGAYGIYIFGNATSLAAEGVVIENATKVTGSTGVRMEGANASLFARYIIDNFDTGVSAKKNAGFCHVNLFYYPNCTITEASDSSSYLGI